MIARLSWLGHEVVVHDPFADPALAMAEYRLDLDPDALNGRYDVVFAAVPHRPYRDLNAAAVGALAAPGALLADLHGIWRDRSLPADLDRWVP